MSHRLTFLKTLALLSGAACSSSPTIDPGPADTGSTTSDTATVDATSDGTTTDAATDSTPSDGTTTDSTTTGDSTPTDGTTTDAPVDVPTDNNKCRYTAGPGYSYVDCAPGKVCRMTLIAGIPTCEAPDGAAGGCGTIQCADACSCLDPGKSICDCVGGAIGPLAPPELLAA